MVYIKLGPTATSFSDSFNNISIIPQQVIAISDVLYNASKNLKLAVSNAYLLLSNVSEYNTWTASDAANPPIVTPSNPYYTKEETDLKLANLLTA